MSESQLVEYKSAWRDEYLKWICGFANAKGGRLYIGIDYRRKITGVANANEMPISLRSKYYIRSGSTLQELKGHALNEFILKRTGKSWDDRALESATFMDIDENAVKAFIRKALKSKRVAESIAEDDSRDGR